MASQDVFQNLDDSHQEINGGEGVTSENQNQQIIEDIFETIETEKDSAQIENTTENSSNGATKEKTIEKSNEPKLSKLPFARVRNIMKLDPDLQIVSLEAVFLVTKATELFIESLSRESFIYTEQGKKKTVQKRDVDKAIENVDSLVFLDGAMDF